MNANRVTERLDRLGKRVGRLLMKGWDESKHPRKPKGSSAGGQFTSAGSGPTGTGDNFRMGDETDEIYSPKQNEMLHHLENMGWEFGGPTGGGGDFRGYQMTLRAPGAAYNSLPLERIWVDETGKWRHTDPNDVEVKSGFGLSSMKAWAKRLKRNRSM